MKHKLLTGSLSFTVGMGFSVLPAVAQQSPASTEVKPNVIIINVEKVIFTGNKLTDKQYRRHTQYPGGQRISTPAEEMKRFPERILEHAVRGMLPKNRLGRAVFKNMHLFVGPEHNHESQQPKVIDINALK